MKKIFNIAGIVMIAIALGYTIFALCKPELSYPWKNEITYGIYGGYLMATLEMFLFPNVKKRNWIDVIVFINFPLVIGLLVASMFMMKDGSSNWYLPSALLLNGINLLVNAYNQRRKKKEQTNEE